LRLYALIDEEPADAKRNAFLVITPSRYDQFADALSFAYEAPTSHPHLKPVLKQATYLQEHKKEGVCLSRVGYF
jgi:hypothetical protein